MKASPQHITLRKLDAADAAFLSALATEAYSQHYANTWTDGGTWYMQTFLSADRLRKELQERCAAFYAIYQQEKAVGFLKLNENKPRPGTAENALEIERIYLTSNSNGNGIGTVVLEWVIEFARSKAIPILWLKVMDTSPAAVHFYQKIGFRICGTHHVHFEQKKEGMRGMFIMEKTL